MVRNHAGGTRERLAAVPRRAHGDVDPGDGLSDVRRWRGDLWTNPREEVRPKGRAAWIGTRRKSRRQGQEGRVYTLTRAAHPGRKDLEGPRTRREALFGRPRRGAVKPITAESTGGTSPRGRPPMGETNGANPFVARERSPVGVCVVVATRFGPSVRGARTRRKVRTTLETRRTTYPPAQASSTPREGALDDPGSPRHT